MKLNRIRKIKFYILFFISLIACVLLLLINRSSFISFVKLGNIWNSDYYHNTTKIIFIAFIVASIATAFSSTSIQNLNGNYIASGGTLGIGASASFGYIIANYFLLYDYWFVITIMVVASIVPVTINFFLINKKTSNKNNAILIGMAISALIGTVNFILRDAMGMINGQLIFLGTLSNDVNWDKIYYVLPLLIIGLLILGYNFKKINIINYSKELADKQQINFNKVFFYTSIGNILVISSSVFFVGQITFLGIIGTNMVRMILKNSSTWIVALSATMFNIIIITVGHSIYQFTNIDLNLSVIILSVPMFILLIRKGN